MRAVEPLPDARHSLSPVSVNPFAVQKPRFFPSTGSRLDGALLFDQPPLDF